MIVHARTEREGEEALDRLVAAGVAREQLRMVAADFTHLGEITVYEGVEPATTAQAAREERSIRRLGKLADQLVSH